MTEGPLDEYLDQFRNLLRESPPPDARGQLRELLILTIMELMDRRLTHMEALKHGEALHQAQDVVANALRLAQKTRDKDGSSWGPSRTVLGAQHPKPSDPKPT